jgi:hypothetical protein
MPAAPGLSAISAAVSGVTLDPATVALSSFARVPQ